MTKGTLRIVRIGLWTTIAATWAVIAVLAVQIHIEQSEPMVWNAGGMP